MNPGHHEHTPRGLTGLVYQYPIFASHSNSDGSPKGYSQSPTLPFMHIALWENQQQEKGIEQKEQVWIWMATTWWALWDLWGGSSSVNLCPFTKGS